MSPERIQMRKGPRDWANLLEGERAMEGDIKKESAKGEKSGFGRISPPFMTWPFFSFKSLAYEKVLLARTLFVILLGLLALIFFGHQQ